MTKKERRDQNMQIQEVLRNDPDKKPRYFRDFAERYADYLKSPWWQYRRQAKLRAVKGKCSRCRRSARDVHHKSYARLGAETDSDLEALCRDCHDAAHGITEARQP